jgi:Homing endonuclease associated repeat
MFMTREEILAGLKKCARKLHRTPVMAEIRSMAKISEYHIRLHFRSLGNALREAGIEARGGGHKIDRFRLLEDWGQLARKLGHPPTHLEYRKAGEFGTATLVKYCGTWSKVGEQFRALVKRQRKEAEWADVLEIVRRWQGATTLAGRRRAMMQARLSERAALGLIHDEPQPPRKIKLDRPIYGPPSNLAGLRYEPTCESGVMFAFGCVAEKLGFEVERIQTAFPDCEAMREVAPGKWQREKIEFELASRNFREHGHPVNGCDIIVCWIHNWAECPEEIEVIELRKVIRRIG